jgi:methyltransferase (TIGR00027 family)
MLPNAPSRTALATAYLRAAHQLLDGPSLLLSDPTALPLLGKGAKERIRAGITRYQTPEGIALRSHLVLRSRYAEDRLSASIKRGVSQYVIVGAGFDSFALRQPDWAGSLKIIEVDHSTTQQAKRQQVAASGITIPANVLFADIDFERESLLDGLLRYGVTPSKPTLFSWLGVTMYLTELAIESTLRSMATFAPGSEVVLDFMQPPLDDTDADLNARSRLTGLVAESGEPFISFFDEAKLGEKLRILGFQTVEFLTPEIAMSRYFQQPGTQLPPPRRTGIVSAMR